MRLESFIESLKDAHVMMRNGYPYIIHPLIDGFPSVEPRIFNEVITEMKNILGSFGSIDKIVTIEAMGVPFASALSLEMNIPFAIIRKRSYGLPEETSIDQSTGYAKGKLYLNGFQKGESVVLVDDVLSLGGTISAVLQALKDMGVLVRGVCVAIDKGTVRKEIEGTFGVPIIPLVTLKVIEEKIQIEGDERIGY